MATYVPAKRATEYIFWVGLVSQADTKLLQTNPTLAAGDVKVSKDGGALANLATLPAVTPASSKLVKVTLSSTEMTADNVTVIFSDAAGAEWCDLLINIQTAARQIDDLTFPNTSGRGMDVDATGGVEITANQAVNVAQWNGTTVATPTVGGVPEVDVTHYGGSAGTFASGRPEVNASHISGDSVAADNAESYFDGTGYGEILVRTTIATLSTQTSFTLTAGSADNDAYNGCIMVIQDAATPEQKAVAVISDYVGSTKTITLLNDPTVFTIATTDIVTIIADRSVKPTVDNRTLDVSSGGEAGLDWANIGSPTTAQNLSGTNIDVDQVVASVTNDVGITQTGADKVWASATRTLTAFSTALAVSVWDVLESAIATASSIGLKVKTNLDATVASRATPAQVNAEVLDVLTVDTFAEPGQEAPAATNTLAVKIAYLFKAWRNRSTQTSTLYALYNDDTTTLAQKSTVSDDGTTFDRGEVGSGP